MAVMEYFKYSDDAPKFSKEAVENIEAAGADWEDDIEAIKTGRHTEASLLKFCLDGATPRYVEGWHDYVDAIMQFCS